MNKEAKGAAPLLKMLIVACLLPVLAFCLFGLLATLEPNPTPVVWSWRIGYAAVAAGISLFAIRIVSKTNP
jgi:hypothetical protein